MKKLIVLFVIIYLNSGKVISLPNGVAICTDQYLGGPTIDPATTLYVLNNDNQVIQSIPIEWIKKVKIK